MTFFRLSLSLNAPAPTEVYALSLHDALPILFVQVQNGCDHRCTFCIIPYGRGNSRSVPMGAVVRQVRSEEHTSELQSRPHLVCRLLLEKKNFISRAVTTPIFTTELSLAAANR